MGACRILRCKDIQFSGFSGNEVETLRELIQSDEDIIDQFEIVKECKELTKTSLAHRLEYSTVALYGEKLLTASMNYAAVRMVDSKPRFSKSVDSMIAGMLEPRRNALQKKIQVLKDEQKKVDAREAVMRKALQKVKK